MPVYEDDFNRADTTPPDSGGTGLGGAWTSSVSNNSMYRISGNKAVQPQQNYDWLATYDVNLGPDHWVEADVDMGSLVDGQRCSVVVRRDDFFNWRFLGFMHWDGTLAIGFNGGGVYEILAQGGSHGSATTGKLRLELEGNTFRLYYNGTLAVTTTDTRADWGRFAGMEQRWGSTQMSVDNFRCGPLPYTPSGGGGSTGTGAATTTWRAAVAAVGAVPGGGGLNITETWTGTTGAGWPSPKWVTVIRTAGGSTGACTIQGNRGRMTIGGEAYGFHQAELASSAHTDVDIRFTYAVNSTAEQYVNVGYRMGADAPFNFPGNGYTLEIAPEGNQVNLMTTDSSGAGTPIATVNSAGVNVTSDLNVRILVVGNSHKVRWWTGTEPSTWQIDITNSAYTAGDFFLGLYCGATVTTRQVEFDNLTVAAPAAPSTAAVLWKGVSAIRESGGLVSDMTALNCSWFYDWGNYNPIPEPWRTGNVDYVPMMWGDWELYGEPGPSTGVGPSKTLLGFNEPDEHLQSDMTVARALALWPQLEATGARLGSPAPSSSGSGLTWLASFMSGNGGPAPRVDFICAHWYPEWNMGFPVFADFLDYLHTTYPTKPIWVTEIGTLGTGTVTSANFAANAAMMPSVFSALATRPWVERIAWFVNRAYPDGTSGFPFSRLVESNGTLNAAGTQYATYDMVIGAQAGRVNLTWVNATTALGKKVSNGSRTVTHSWVSAGVGKKTPKGSRTATDAWVLTSAGKRAPKAAATTTHVDTLSATGKRSPVGSRTVTHAWAVSATGIKPTVGMKMGSATVSHSYAVTAAGKKTPKGAATVIHTDAITAAGSTPPKGSATTTWANAVTAVGKRVPKGAATTADVQATAGTGKRIQQSAGVTGFVIYLLAAQGQAPIVGVRQGSGFTSLRFNPSGSGAKTPKGGNSVTYAFTLSVAGKRIQQGTATLAYQDTVTAAGKRAPKSTVTVTYANTLTAVGKKFPKGATPTTFFNWTASANGFAPLVGFRQGFATIVTPWVIAAAGKKAPKGSNTTLVTFVTSAAGKKLQKATVLTSFGWATTAGGKRSPKSSLVVTDAWRVTGAGKRAPKGRADPSYRYQVTAMGLSGISGQVEGVWNGLTIVEMQYGSKMVVGWEMVPA